MDVEDEPILEKNFLSVIMEENISSSNQVYCVENSMEPNGLEL